MSVADSLEWDDTRIRPQGQADTRPAPTFFETAAAGFRYARDDQTGHTDEERQGAYGPVITALKERGYDPRRYVNPYGGEPVNYDAVWRDIGAARKTDANAFKELGDRDAFEKGWRSQFASRQARDADTMRRGGFVGTLAGGLVGSLTDPINVGGMVLTGGWGGTSVAGRMLAEAAINTGIEALETPLTMAERAKQGRELTGEEIAMNLGFAAAGGAAFKGAEIGGGKLIAKAVESVPLDVRAAMALRQSVPDYAMTPDQAAALHIIDRGFEVDSSNPFAGTYDSMEAHARRIDETIAAMSRWPEAGAVQALRPAVKPVAPSAGPLRTDFDSLWSAIIGNEGGTNRDGSFRTSPKGAIGPAQVMPGTAPEAARLAGLPWDEGKYRSDHAYNVALGKAYYRDLLRQFDNDPVKAAAAYNAGPGSIRRGTGLRGAMERARRAGVPDDWVSFLPGETRQYVADFRRRTSGAVGDTVEGVGARADVDVDITLQRSPDLDVERPLVDRADGPDLEPSPGRVADGAADLDVDLPVLRRDLFASDDEWRAAQSAVDAEAFGSLPVQSTRPLSDIPDLASARAPDQIAGRAIDDAPAPLEIRERPDAEIRSNVGPNAVDDVLLGPIFAAPRGEPGVRVEGVGGGSRDDDLLVSVFRDETGAAKGVLYFPANEAGVRFNQENGYGISVYVDPAYRRQGIATKLYDEAAKVAPWVNRMSGSGDLTPAGAAFSRARRDLVRSRAAEVGQTPALRDEIDAAGGDAPAVIDVEAGKVFDDPGGDAVGRVADLAWHDAQMAMADGGDAGRTFDLGDGRGERSFADIQAELRADDDAISTIEGCLFPGPAGAVA